MLNLNKVTLFQLNCVDPDVGVQAMKYSSRGINFGKKVLVSHERPHNLPEDFDFYQIEKLNHIETSKIHFGKNGLNQYIETDYYISIHPDGFIINPELWTDEFFEYDYIGAPWPPMPWNHKNRVGNGGFRFESKKLLEICATLEWNGQHDDVFISNTHKELFESNGCKFPSVEIAARFSLEHKIPEVEYDLNKCFGFHGKLTEESRQYVEMVKNYI